MEWQRPAESLREYTIEILPIISYIKHINLWPSNELMTGVFMGQIIVIKCVGVASQLPQCYSVINVFDIRMNTFDVLSPKKLSTHEIIVRHLRLVPLVYRFHTTRL
jgi:hypothetical protein